VFIHSYESTAAVRTNYTGKQTNIGIETLKHGDLRAALSTLYIAGPKLRPPVSWACIGTGRLNAHHIIDDLDAWGRLHIVKWQGQSCGAQTCGLGCNLRTFAKLEQHGRSQPSGHVDTQ
jgi:hypothetical protein